MVLNFWPFNRPKKVEEPERFNVKIAVAKCILDNGEVIQVTRKGHLLSVHYKWIAEGDYRLERHLDANWVLADDGITYNRHYIRSYTYETSDYFVVADYDKEIEASQ
jgi:hypothetical protein